MFHKMGVRPYWTDDNPFVDGDYSTLLAQVYSARMTCKAFRVNVLIRNSRVSSKDGIWNSEWNWCLGEGLTCYALRLRVRIIVFCHFFLAILRTGQKLALVCITFSDLKSHALPSGRM